MRIASKSTLVSETDIEASVKLSPTALLVLLPPPSDARRAAVMESEGASAAARGLLCLLSETALDSEYFRSPFK